MSDPKRGSDTDGEETLTNHILWSNPINFEKLAPFSYFANINTFGSQHRQIYKIQWIFSKGGGLFLIGGEMVSHGDSTVKWAKIWASDNRVETSVDSQWVTWSNTKNRKKMNLTN